MHIPALWKANVIAFISSFCVMVIELIAARILAPYIGVSLYTWTSIIGIILTGIALGNYLGGKIADRYASPLALMIIFLVGGLTTIAILPTTRLVTSADLFSNLPIMANFVMKTAGIFFIPAIILSMVSPMVIKLTLADLGKTGGVVGTIYAFSTAGAILGTFMTGFFFILWFGTRTIVWLVAAVLLFIGILVWFSWRIQDRWQLSAKNFAIWAVVLLIILASCFLFLSRQSWYAQTNESGEETEGVYTVTYTRESNYYTIRVLQSGPGQALALDRLIHSITFPGEPTRLFYDYLDIFSMIVGYYATDNPAPRVLHLGGGGYAFPRYMEVVYPESTNEVVEIDPAVTEVVYEKLGLPRDTSIKTYNQDARLFLTKRKTGPRYDIIIGDVFSDRSTPYHLTTLEFDKLAKANLEEDGIYLVYVIDLYGSGRYMPAFVNTLRHAFQYVYLFGDLDGGENIFGSFVIAATDNPIDLVDYREFVLKNEGKLRHLPQSEDKLDEYLAARNPILLTDDYAPTDILVAPIQTYVFK